MPVSETLAGLKTISHFISGSFNEPRTTDTPFAAKSAVPLSLGAAPRGQSGGVGAFNDAPSGRSGVVWDPATGQEQAHVAFASVEEVNQAVAAAKAAFPAWRATPLSRRAEVMFRFRDLVDANRRRLAELVTSEHGKTLPDALGEVAR